MCVYPPLCKCWYADNQKQSHCCTVTLSPAPPRWPLTPQVHRDFQEQSQWDPSLLRGAPAGNGWPEARALWQTHDAGSPRRLPRCRPRPRWNPDGHHERWRRIWRREAGLVLVAFCLVNFQSKSPGFNLDSVFLSVFMKLYFILFYDSNVYWLFFLYKHK